jgi:hypothetical protein
MMNNFFLLIITKYMKIASMLISLKFFRSLNHPKNVFNIILNFINFLLKIFNYNGIQKVFLSIFRYNNVLNKKNQDIKIILNSQVNDLSLLKENLFLLKLYCFFTQNYIHPELLMNLRFKNFYNFLKERNMQIVSDSTKLIKKNNESTVIDKNAKLSFLENSIKKNVSNISNYLRNNDLITNDTGVIKLRKNSNKINKEDIQIYRILRLKKKFLEKKKHNLEKKNIIMLKNKKTFFAKLSKISRKLDNINVKIKALYKKNAITTNNFYNSTKIKSYKLLEKKDFFFNNDDYLEDYLKYINIFRPKKKKIKLSHIKKIKNGNKMLISYLFKEREFELDFILNIKKPLYSNYIKNDQNYRTNFDVALKKPIVRRIYNYDPALKDKYLQMGIGKFSDNIGFLNSNITSQEQYDNLVDVPRDPININSFYVINPFLVLGFIIYSLLEFFLFCFFVFKITGNPFKLLILFLEYPSSYFFENLTNFPSMYFYFYSLFLWFLLLVGFFVKLLEIFNEPDFDDLESSFIFVFFINFLYVLCIIFLFSNLIIFFNELNSLLFDVFFIGSPQMSAIIAIPYHLFYDLIKLLCSFSYFAEIIDNKDNVYYNSTYNFPSFSEYVMLKNRSSFLNIYDYQILYDKTKSIKLNNIFLFFFNNLNDLFFKWNNYEKFIYINDRQLWKRELLQDIRKYNFLKKKYNELLLVGKFYDHIYYGKNFRLDLQYVQKPLIAQDQNIFFGWRFKDYTENLYLKSNDIALDTHASKRKKKMYQSTKITNLNLFNSRTNFYDYNLINDQITYPFHDLIPTMRFSSYSFINKITNQNNWQKINSSFLLGFFFSGLGKFSFSKNYSSFIKFDYYTFNQQNLYSFFSNFFHANNKNKLFFFKHLLPYYNEINDNNNYIKSFSIIPFNEKQNILNQFYPQFREYNYNDKLIPLDLLVQNKIESVNFIENNIFKDPYFKERKFINNYSKAPIFQAIDFIVNSKITNFIINDSMNFFDKLVNQCDHLEKTVINSFVNTSFFSLNLITDSLCDLESLIFRGKFFEHNNIIIDYNLEKKNIINNTNIINEKLIFKPKKKMKVILSKNYANLRINIQKKHKVFNSCYLLDAKIQNYSNFMNIYWNQYYHFFFKRSYKSYGSGIDFKFYDTNTNNKLASYKTILSKGTLNENRVGNYLLDNISWMQYKFKWLLYSTSTYKRFDSFRAIQQSSDKRFYFASLLKFYQINFFKWQQSVKYNNWSLIQIKNFLIHLFFLKQNRLKNISEIEDFLIYSNDKYQKKNINLNNEKSFFFKPIVNKNDWNYLQNIMDSRRFIVLYGHKQIKKWYFNKYVHYLGPLFNKSDISSLMGFFAPIEYRNQIFLSKLKKDAVRFSIFFPKKNKINDSSGDFIWNKPFSYEKKNIKNDQFFSEKKDKKSKIFFNKFKYLYKRADGWFKFNNVLSYNSQTPYYVNFEQMWSQNFGLSGIGRLPVLFRTYFVLLFKKNQIEDFIQIKQNFLKLQIMSLQGFNYYNNKNEKFLFWKLFLMKNKSFNIIFQNNNSLSKIINYNSLIYHPKIGLFTEYYNMRNNNIIILKAQYNYINQAKKFYQMRNLNLLNKHNIVFLDQINTNKLSSNIIKNLKNNVFFFNFKNYIIDSFFVDFNFQSWKKNKLALNYLNLIKNKKNYIIPPFSDFILDFFFNDNLNIKSKYNYDSSPQFFNKNIINNKNDLVVYSEILSEINVHNNSNKNDFNNLIVCLPASENSFFSFNDINSTKNQVTSQNIEVKNKENVISKDKDDSKFHEIINLIDSLYCLIHDYYIVFGSVYELKNLFEIENEFNYSKIIIQNNILKDDPDKYLKENFENAFKIIKNDLSFHNIFFGFNFQEIKLKLNEIEKFFQSYMYNYNHSKKIKKQQTSNEASQFKKKGLELCSKFLRMIETDKGEEFRFFIDKMKLIEKINELDFKVKIIFSHNKQDNIFFENIPKDKKDFLLNFNFLDYKKYLISLKEKIYNQKNDIAIIKNNDSSNNNENNKLHQEKINFFLQNISPKINNLRNIYSQNLLNYLFFLDKFKIQFNSDFSTQNSLLNYNKIDKLIQNQINSLLKYEIFISNSIITEVIINDFKAELMHLNVIIVDELVKIDDLLLKLNDFIKVYLIRDNKNKILDNSLLIDYLINDEFFKKLMNEDDFVKNNFISIIIDFFIINLANENILLNDNLMQLSDFLIQQLVLYNNIFLKMPDFNDININNFKEKNKEFIIYYQNLKIDINQNLESKFYNSVNNCLIIFEQLVYNLILDININFMTLASLLNKMIINSFIKFSQHNNDDLNINQLLSNLTSIIEKDYNNIEIQSIIKFNDILNEIFLQIESFDNNIFSIDDPKQISTYLEDNLIINDNKNEDENEDKRNYILININFLKEKIFKNAFLIQDINIKNKIYKFLEELSFINKEKIILKYYIDILKLLKKTDIVLEDYLVAFKNNLFKPEIENSIENLKPIIKRVLFTYEDISSYKNVLLVFLKFFDFELFTEQYLATENLFININKILQNNNKELFVIWQSKLLKQHELLKEMQNIKIIDIELEKLENIYTGEEKEKNLNAFEKRIRYKKKANKIITYLVEEIKKLDEDKKAFKEGFPIFIKDSVNKLKQTNEEISLKNKEFNEIQYLNFVLIKYNCITDEMEKNNFINEEIQKLTAKLAYYKKYNEINNLFDNEMLLCLINISFILFNKTQSQEVMQFDIDEISDGIFNKSMDFIYYVFSELVYKEYKELFDLSSVKDYSKAILSRYKDFFLLITDKSYSSMTIASNLQKKYHFLKILKEKLDFTNTIKYINLYENLLKTLIDYNKNPLIINNVKFTPQEQVLFKKIQIKSEKQFFKDSIYQLLVISHFLEIFDYNKNKFKKANDYILELISEIDLDLENKLSKIRTFLAINNIKYLEIITDTFLIPLKVYNNNIIQMLEQYKKQLNDKNKEISLSSEKNNFFLEDIKRRLMYYKNELNKNNEISLKYKEFNEIQYLNYILIKYNSIIDEVEKNNFFDKEIEKLENKLFINQTKLERYIKMKNECFFEIDNYEKKKENLIDDKLKNMLLKNKQKINNEFSTYKIKMIEDLKNLTTELKKINLDKHLIMYKFKCLQDYVICFKTLFEKSKDDFYLISTTETWDPELTKKEYSLDVNLLKNQIFELHYQIKKSENKNFIYKMKLKKITDLKQNLKENLNSIINEVKLQKNSNILNDLQNKLEKKKKEMDEVTQNIEKNRDLLFKYEELKKINKDLEYKKMQTQDKKQIQLYKNNILSNLIKMKQIQFDPNQQNDKYIKDRSLLFNEQLILYTSLNSLKDNSIKENNLNVSNLENLIDDNLIFINDIIKDNIEKKLTFEEPFLNLIASLAFLFNNKENEIFLIEKSPFFDKINELENIINYFDFNESKNIIILNNNINNIINNYMNFKNNILFIKSIKTNNYYFFNLQFQKFFFNLDNYLVEYYLPMRRELDLLLVKNHINDFNLNIDKNTKLKSLQDVIFFYKQTAMYYNQLNLAIYELADPFKMTFELLNEVILILNLFENSKKKFVKHLNNLDKILENNKVLFLRYNNINENLKNFIKKNISNISLDNDMNAVFDIFSEQKHLKKNKTSYFNNKDYYLKYYLNEFFNEKNKFEYNTYGIKKHYKMRLNLNNNFLFSSFFFNKKLIISKYIMEFFNEFNLNYIYKFNPNIFNKSNFNYIYKLKHSFDFLYLLNFKQLDIIYNKFNYNKSKFFNYKKYDFNYKKNSVFYNYFLNNIKISFIIKNSSNSIFYNYNNFNIISKLNNYNILIDRTNFNYFFSNFIYNKMNSNMQINFIILKGIKTYKNLIKINFISSNDMINNNISFLKNKQIKNKLIYNSFLFSKLYNGSLITKLNWFYYPLIYYSLIKPYYIIFINDLLINYNLNIKNILFGNDKILYINNKKYHSIFNYDLNNYQKINIYFFDTKIFNFIKNFNYKSYNIINEFDDFNKELINNMKIKQNIFNDRKSNFLNSKINKIYTYAEFDKFKNDFHRQRFRSVFPYWIQNSIRNVYQHKNDSIEPRYKGGPVWERLNIGETFEESYRVPIKITKYSDMGKISRANNKFPLRSIYDTTEENKFLFDISDLVLKQKLRKKNKFRIKDIKFLLNKNNIINNIVQKNYKKHINISPLANLGDKRVIMYIPYNYAKWYTHNPRLSYKISQDLLNIYTINQFGEFQNILFQTFYLLKKKIMYDVFMLKSFKYKQNILYNFPIKKKNIDNYNKFNYMFFLKKLINFSFFFKNYLYDKFIHSKSFINYLNDYKNISFSLSNVKTNKSLINNFIYKNASYDIYNNISLYKTKNNLYNQQFEFENNYFSEGNNYYNVIVNYLYKFKNNINVPQEIIYNRIYLPSTLIKFKDFTSQNFYKGFYQNYYVMNSKKNILIKDNGQAFKRGFTINNHNKLSYFRFNPFLITAPQYPFKIKISNNKLLFNNNWRNFVYNFYNTNNNWQNILHKQNINDIGIRRYISLNKFNFINLNFCNNKLVLHQAFNQPHTWNRYTPRVKLDYYDNFEYDSHLAGQAKRFENYFHTSGFFSKNNNIFSNILLDLSYKQLSISDIQVYNNMYLNLNKNLALKYNYDNNFFLDYFLFENLNNKYNKYDKIHTQLKRFKTIIHYNFNIIEKSKKNFNEKISYTKFLEIMPIKTIKRKSVNKEDFYDRFIPKRVIWYRLIDRNYLDKTLKYYYRIKNFKFYFDFNGYKKRKNFVIFFNSKNNNLFLRNNNAKFFRLGLYLYNDPFITDKNYNFFNNINYKNNIVLMLFIYKINLYYYFILFIDFFINLLFFLNLFLSKIIILKLSFLNFKIIIDFLIINNIKKNSFFFFFHTGFFIELSKFVWLIKSKFLIFHIYYYFFYFLVFFFFIVSRTIIDYYSWKKSSQEVLDRFNWTDKNINSDEHWFDSLTRETIKDLEEEILIMKNNSRYKLLNKITLKEISIRQFLKKKQKRPIVIDPIIKLYNLKDEIKNKQLQKDTFFDLQEHKHAKLKENYFENNKILFNKRLKYKIKKHYKIIYLDRQQYRINILNNLLYIKDKIKANEDIFPSSDNEINLNNFKLDYNNLMTYKHIIKSSWVIFKEIIIYRFLFFNVKKQSQLNEYDKQQLKTFIYIYGSSYFELIYDFIFYIYISIKFCIIYLMMNIRKIFFKDISDNIPNNIIFNFLGNDKIKIDDFIFKSNILYKIACFYDNSEYNLNINNLGTGKEFSQLYYIIEFDNIEDNYNINTFSKFISPRSFSKLYNKSYFIFPSNAQIPDTFDEFLLQSLKTNKKQYLDYISNINDYNLSIKARRKFEYFIKVWNVSKYLTSHNRLPYEDLKSNDPTNENFNLNIDFIKTKQKTKLAETNFFQSYLQKIFYANNKIKIKREKIKQQNIFDIRSFKLFKILFKKFDSLDFYIREFIKKLNNNYPNFITFLFVKFFSYDKKLPKLKFRIKQDKLKFINKLAYYNKKKKTIINMKKFKPRTMQEIEEKNKKKKLLSLLLKKRMVNLKKNLYSQRISKRRFNHTFLLDFPSISDNDLYNSYTQSPNTKNFPTIFNYFIFSNFRYYFYYFCMFFVLFIIFLFLFLFLFFLLNFLFFYL